MDPADLLERADVRRVALGELDERRIAEHGADRAVLLGRGALAPGRQLARHRAGPRVELPDARKPLPGGVGVALVGGGLEAPALLAGPIEAAGLLEAALNLVGELEQVGDVLGGVAQLLGGQRPRVPARVARGLPDPAPSIVAEQVAVTGLRARAANPAASWVSKMFVDLRGPRAAEDRDVLAAGVEHDLDRRVGRAAPPPGSTSTPDSSGSISSMRGSAARRRRLVDRDLDQAQQRPVAALGHELGVDPDPSVRARHARRCRDVLGGGEGAGGFAASLACASRLETTEGATAGHGCPAERPQGRRAQRGPITNPTPW